MGNGTAGKTQAQHAALAAPFGVAAEFSRRALVLAGRKFAAEKFLAGFFKIRIFTGKNFFRFFRNCNHVNPSFSSAPGGAIKVSTYIVTEIDA